jgi:peptidoglycan/xylan/chitin deacetylase (PgdA/CDA1 family)
VLWYQSIPLWFQKLFRHLEWQVPNLQNEVFLTFDDGPHPEITQWVLNELDRYNMKATFFCVGDNVRKYPGIYGEVLDKGHRTGNHTMHHLKGWANRNEIYINNVAECATYVRSNLFRPPYGRVRRSQANILRQEYRIIMWSLLSCDFEQGLDTVKALDGLKKNTRAGSIIVFHDSAKAEKNLKAMLPLYLQFLNEKGFNCRVL